MKRKVYVTGSDPSIRVPFAEVSLDGDNPPVRLYDTSGPGSDPVPLGGPVQPGPRPGHGPRVPRRDAARPGGVEVYH